MGREKKIKKEMNPIKVPDEKTVTTSWWLRQQHEQKRNNNNDFSGVFLVKKKWWIANEKEWTKKTAEICWLK